MDKKKLPIALHPQVHFLSLPCSLIECCSYFVSEFASFSSCILRGWQLSFSSLETWSLKNFFSLLFALRMPTYGNISNISLKAFLSSFFWAVSWTHPLNPALLLLRDHPICSWCRGCDWPLAFMPMCWFMLFTRELKETKWPKHNKTTHSKHFLCFHLTVFYHKLGIFEENES